MSDDDLDLSVDSPGDAAVADGAATDDLVSPSDLEAPDAPLSEVDVLTAERNEWQDRAQRIAAEFDNFRKRAASQQTEEVGRATGKLAEALLPVLDAAEAAFVQHPAEIEPLFNLLLGELRKQGLESMNLYEQPFDPNLAEAVMHEPGEGATDGPVVAEVLRSGYTWKGRVLRPAMVKVRG
jgi:molecular chaperone GrpE